MIEISVFLPKSFMNKLEWLHGYLFDILHRFILESWFPLSWIVILSFVMMIMSKNYIKYYLGSTEHSFTNSHVKSTFYFIINTIITYILYLLIMELYNHYVSRDIMIPRLFAIKPLLQSSKKELMISFHSPAFMEWITLALINILVQKLVKYSILSSFSGSLFVMSIKWWLSTISFVLLKSIREYSENRWINSNNEHCMDAIIILNITLLLILFMSINMNSERYFNTKVSRISIYAALVSIAIWNSWILMQSYQSNIIDTLLSSIIDQGKWMAILMLNRFIFFSIYHGSYDMVRWLNQIFSQDSQMPPIFTPFADDITTTFIFQFKV